MHESPTFAHCTVIDATGHKVGTVSDVVSDPETLQPRWLVVDVGLLHTGHYMPVAGSRLSPEGELLVPFEKDMVQRAPKAHGSHVLSVTDEGDLCAYYGIHN